MIGLQRLTAASLLCLGCAAGHASSRTAAIHKSACQFDVRALEPEPLVLEVTTRCRGQNASEYLVEPGTAQYLSHVASTEGQGVVMSGRSLRLPAEAGGLRYRVRLGEMAMAHANLDLALGVGRSVLAPGYSWLVSPAGVSADTPVIVHYTRDTGGWDFTTGLAAYGEGYRLRAGEISVATFGVFGRFERSELRLPGIGGAEARLELVTLDGELAADPAVLRHWVRDTARAVSKFYAGFPVERAMLALVPVPGRRGILRGKVLPESSPGIALLIGERATIGNLYADWILTHELFHLGFPSFVGEGKWLDEGMATYFEPLIRARQGWLSEQELWAEFYTHMPKGLRVLEQDGLETPRSVGAMYWAGATLCLLADIEAHQRSDGRRTLQHAVRALLRAQGDATRVWRLADAISTMDRVLGEPIIARLSARHTKSGAPVSLHRVFQELGVIRTATGFQLDDTTPLAHVRRAITRGTR